MADRSNHAELPVSLIWIDCEEAVLARWNGSLTLDRLRSDVPPHHKSTGNVRIDPQTRHGGGGPVEDRLERWRQEHLREFLVLVARRIPATDEVTILGPGVVREHLERLLLADDRRHHRTRTVDTRPSGRLSERQLVARLREMAGTPPKRRSLSPVR